MYYMCMYSKTHIDGFMGCGFTSKGQEAGYVFSSVTSKETSH